MGKRRCQLCGGKLNHNICTECGLDNSKTDDNYRTSATECAQEPMTHTHSGRENPYAGKTTAQNQTYQTAPNQAYTASQNQAYNTAKGQATRASQNQTKPQKKKKKGIVGRLITFFVIAGIAGSIVESVVPVLKEVFQGETYTEDYEYDPYDSVTRELSETGEDYDVTLSAGLYSGGVHIPEGTYEVTLESGEGELELEDDENSIRLSESLGSEMDQEDKLEDVNIYKGSVLEVSGDVKLHFQTSNAQMPLEGMENPNTVSKTLSEKIVVGKDIPAGVYDVTCEDGSGIFEYYVKQDGDNESYEGKLIGDKESSFPDTFLNVVLPDGVVVTMTDMTVTLTPSEVIASEDYDNYYIW